MSWIQLTVVSVLAPLAILMSVSGAIIPGALAGAVNCHPEMAGTASGLSSAIGIAIAGLFTIAAGMLYRGDYLPVAWLITLACVLTGAAWGLAIGGKITGPHVLEEHRLFARFQRVIVGPSEIDPALEVGRTGFAGFPEHVDHGQQAIRREPFAASAQHVTLVRRRREVMQRKAGHGQVEGPIHPIQLVEQITLDEQHIEARPGLALEPREKRAVIHVIVVEQLLVHAPLVEQLVAHAGRPRPRVCKTEYATCRVSRRVPSQAHWRRLFRATPHTRRSRP